MIVQYITKTDLKENRGWTEAAIKRFLGTEDKQSRNSYYHSTAYLYLIERVQQIELTEEFAIWKRSSEKRRAAARKGAETRKLREQKERIEEQQRAQEQQKQQRLFIEALSATQLNITPLTYKELVAKAFAEWSLANPEIAPVFSIKTEVIKHSEIIELLQGYGSKRIPQLLTRTHKALESYYEILEKDDQIKLKKVRQNFYFICKEFCKLFKHLKGMELQAALKVFSSLLDLEWANKFNEHTSTTELCNWLVNVVEVFDEDNEQVIIKDEGIKAICVQDLINQQILRAYTTELSALESELNSLVEHFRQWLPLAEKQAKKRYYQAIREKYPCFSLK